MNAGTCRCGCGASLAGLRADAVWASEACKKRAERAASRDKAGTVHPLQTVRERQAAKKHNRDLGGLIRQAIIDQIKTTGECFADDLVDLYPEGEVKECRRLATAQFGSMVARGLIHEKGRRKSTFASRKGSKSGVYSFTQLGRKTLAPTDYESAGANTLVGKEGEGSSADVAGRGPARSLLPGEKAQSVCREPQGPAGRLGDLNGTGCAPSGSTLAGVGGGSSDGAVVPTSAAGHTSHSDEEDISVARSPEQQEEATSSSSPCADVNQGSSEGVVASSLSEEPARLPGFEESAAAQNMRDAA